MHLLLSTPIIACRPFEKRKKNGKEKRNRKKKKKQKKNKNYPTGSDGATVKVMYSMGQEPWRK